MDRLELRIDLEIQERKRVCKRRGYMIYGGEEEGDMC